MFPLRAKGVSVCVCIYVYIVQQQNPQARRELRIAAQDGPRPPHGERAWSDIPKQSSGTRQRAWIKGK